MEKYIKYMFIVPQKAAIKDGNKYLILKRSPTSQTYPDCWDFPGGKMEKGEDVAKGLEREVKEETGLKIKVIKPVFTFGEELFKTPHVFIVYICEKMSGKIKLSHEHTEFRWAKKEEILKLKTEKYLRAFLETI